MAERNREIGYIVIRGNETIPTRARDEHIPIMPLTDEWLVHPDRTWEEIDSVLEGRLSEVEQALFIEEGKPASVLAKSYGIEKPVESATARLLAYSEIIDEYENACNSYRNRANVLKEEFGTREKEIYKKHGKNLKAAYKESQALHKTDYNPSIIEQSTKLRTAKKVENLILRKAVMDLLSVNNNDKNPLVSLSSLPKMVSESKANRARLPSQTEKSVKPDPITSFVNQLSGYLEETKDSNLYQRYTYHSTPGIISKRSDSEILETAITYLLDTEALISDPAIAVTFRNFGSSYMRFLKNRASSISKEPHSSEPYPTISLLYDIYTSSLVKGLPAVLKNLSVITEPYFSDVLLSKSGNIELTRFFDAWQKRVSTTFAKMENLFVAGNENYVAEEGPEFISSTEFRIYTGLSEVAFYSSDLLGGGNASKVFMNNIYSKAYGEGRSLTGKSEPVEAQYLQQFVKAAIGGNLRSSSIELDLTSMLVHDRTFPDDIQRLTLPKDTRIQELHEFFDSIASHDSVILENALFRQYLASFWKEREIDSETVERENNVLWEEILNNANWFVSLRGDRFHKEKDPQLAEYAIESLTYFTDKAYPREHRVEVVFTSIPQQKFNLWLDTKRNTLGSSHQVLFTNQLLRNAFTNMLLKRLYYITSGTLSNRYEAPKRTKDHGKIIYRRSFLRHFFSTEERQITMESPEAKKHAAEVLFYYGIDIYKERERRVDLKTLSPDEFITFVRETDIERTDKLPPKNLTYDPSRLIIPE